MRRNNTITFKVPVWAAPLWGELAACLEERGESLSRFIKCSLLAVAPEAEALLNERSEACMETLDAGRECLGRVILSAVRGGGGDAVELDVQA